MKSKAIIIATIVFTCLLSLLSPRGYSQSPGKPPKAPDNKMEKIQNAFEKLKEQNETLIETAKQGKKLQKEQMAVLLGQIEKLETMLSGAIVILDNLKGLEERIEKLENGTGDFDIVLNSMEKSKEETKNVFSKLKNSRLLGDEVSSGSEPNEDFPLFYNTEPPPIADSKPSPAPPKKPPPSEPELMPEPVNKPHPYESAPMPKNQAEWMANMQQQMTQVQNALSIQLQLNRETRQMADQVTNELETLDAKETSEIVE